VCQSGFFFFFAILRPASLLSFFNFFTRFLSGFFSKGFLAGTEFFFFFSVVLASVVLWVLIYQKLGVPFV